MTYATFLDQSRGQEQNTALLILTRAAVVESAVAGAVIADDDLAMVPELMSILGSLAGQSRDDLYEHANAAKAFVSIPDAQRVFCYNFTKGYEAAERWHFSPTGSIELAHDAHAIWAGTVPVNVPEDYLDGVNAGVELVQDVFVDFQNDVLADPELCMSRGGRLLADGLAYRFF